MERQDELHKHRKVLGCLSSLPRKILSIHERDDLCEFVLHDLCNESCFNITRAAYFVDNPDFDCLKGVAGFSREEACRAPSTIWQNPHEFSAFIHEAPFNYQVRAVQTKSVKAHGHSPDFVVEALAPGLGFKNPSWCAWDNKHFNHGLIIYEKGDLAEDVFDQHFIDSLCLLGFCAIH